MRCVGAGRGWRRHDHPCHSDRIPARASVARNFSRTCLSTSTSSPGRWPTTSIFSLCSTSRRSPGTRAASTPASGSDAGPARQRTCSAGRAAGADRAAARDGKLVASTLSMVSETFEHMVLDLPTTWQQWTFDVLAGSDQIYVVTEFTVPAMRKAHELAEAIPGALARGHHQGHRQQIPTATLRRAAQDRCRGLLGDRLAGFVPEDYELVSEAINRGEFVSAISRSNRLIKQLGRIVLNE